MASVNPVDALGASFSVTLPSAGAYYLSVQGAGKGDPLGTGYTNYGSVGHYGVSASVPASGSQAPVGVITASTLRGTAPLTVSFSGAGSSDADGSIVGYAWTFGDASSGSGVTSSHVYTTPGSIHVEADASSASYFIALGAITTPATASKDHINPAKPVRIEGVGAQSIQGDIRFVEAAQAMGAVVKSGENHLEISRGAWPLKAIDLDCNHIPDAAMTLAVMALYADGTTTLRNIASWRVKETDRIEAMATELRKLGATVEEGLDFIRITPPASATDWKTAAIHTYDDHRIAMCFSLAAFNPAGLPIRILDPKCVAKTYPDYFEALFSVAQTSREYIPVITIDGPNVRSRPRCSRSR